MEQLSSQTVEYAKKYASLKHQKDQLDLQVKDIEAEMDLINIEMVRTMEEVGMQRFALDGIGTFYLATNFYPKIVGDSAKVIAWLDAQGANTVAPRKINIPALRELIEERMEKDQPVPPADLVESHSETKVRLRAVGKKTNGGATNG